jgi:hypothetical protein
MWLSLSLVCVAACGDDEHTGGHGNVDGTYAATRTVTQSEPSPAFAVPTMMQITVTGDDVQTSTGNGVLPPSPVVHHSDDAVHITFQEGETWTSPEGDGAVTLTYALELEESGTLTGSIGAKIIFDTPTMGSDFDYALDVTGQKLTR